MLTVVDRLVDSWDTAAAGGEYVDVPKSMTSLTFDVIGRCGFSYDFDSFGRTEPDPFIAAMCRALEYINRSSNDIPSCAPSSVARRVSSTNATSR